MPRLEEARQTLAAEILARVTNDQSCDGVEAIIALPEWMLNHYRTTRRTSILGMLLGAAKQLRETVDRVVIVGSPADCAAARALFAVGCHPYHNEQGRGDRGGRPRIYFAPGGYDNDALQGLLDLLPHERPAATVDERWGIVVIDSGNTRAKDKDEESAEDAESDDGQSLLVVLRVLLAALRRSCSDQAAVGGLVFSTTVPESPFSAACDKLEFGEQFELSHGAFGAAGMFSPAGLLPGALMGLDVVRLLEGAAAMNEYFRTAPIGQNPPLDLAGICELIRRQDESSESFLPRFVGNTAGCEAIAEWCESLLESVRLRNCRERPPWRSGSVAQLNVNIVSQSVRRDRMTVEPAGTSNEPLAAYVGKTLPELNAAAHEAACVRAAAAGMPSVDFRLPGLDEFSVGQLFQALIIATVLEV